MSSLELPPRIAVLGARGIGQVHARVFKNFNADICAVLGSSHTTAKQAANQLNKSLGIISQPYSDFETLINEARPAAVSICTPPECHFSQILMAFDNRIPVFCEKPLIWGKDFAPETVEQKLSTIGKHPNRMLFVNTSNAAFMESVLEIIGRPAQVKCFSFKFFTQGSYIGKEIAIDLLPHGCSLLLKLLGVREITHLSENIQDHFYGCKFKYGNSDVDFEFREHPEGPKHFTFTIDHREFTRVQKGQGNNYRVFLIDSFTEQEIEIQDPFKIYISKFLACLNNDADMQKDEFAEGAANLRLMTCIVLGGAI